MKPWIKWAGAGLLGLAGLGIAAAQEDASADALIVSARQVAQQVDSDRAGEAWDAGSQVLRERVPRERFVASARTGRQSFAAVNRRVWAGVIRVRQDQDTGMPVGLYCNVDFSTLLADGSVMFELVTLRQDADGRWRLVGYVPRRNQ